MTIHDLDQATSVSGQIRPQDMERLASAGFTVVLNHRPDDEERGQPSGAELEAAADAAGLRYLEAPTRGLPTPETIALTAAAMESAGESGRVLMFCRSGMRSAAAWAMAERGRGRPADELRAAAARAGYDLSGLPL